MGGLIGGEWTGPWGAQARAARALLGLSAASLAQRAGVSLDLVQAHERDWLIGRADHARIRQAYEAAGIVFHEWPDGAPLGVSIHFGFLTERRLIEAGRGWLKWRRRKLANLAGIPMRVANSGELAPAQVADCEAALRAAHCGFWRDSGGKLIGVKALRHPGAARVRFAHGAPQGRAWE